MRFDRMAPGGGVDVKCRLENARAYLEWSFYVMGDSGQAAGHGSPWPSRGTVRVCLKDYRGDVVMEGIKPLGEEEPLEGILLKPHLWDGTKDPYLYRAEAVLTDERGRILDGCSGKIPLRSLESRKNCGEWEVLLNGEIFRPRPVFYALPDDGSQAGNQSVIMEDLRQMIGLGANLVCIGKEGTEGHLASFARLCDRYGLLACARGQEGQWEFVRNRNVKICFREETPVYRGEERGLFLPGDTRPTSLYYRYKARWGKEPFVYLAPDSVAKLKSGNYSVCCYSNCGRVALYTDGSLFEFQKGQEEFIFREIPAKSPCIMLNAEGDGCAAALSVHKMSLSTALARTVTE